MSPPDNVIDKSAKVNGIFKLTDNVLKIPDETVVYILRPDLDELRRVINQSHRQHNSIDSYILFVPRRTIECDELLKQYDLLKPDRIFNVSLDLLQLENDLFSLELPNNFAHTLLRDDDLYKVYVQNSVNRIESVFGHIKFKYGIGQNSSDLINRMNKIYALKQAETGLNTSNTVQRDPEIDGLIMIDRQCDLISPFCMQATYEGLLDDTFGIECTHCTIPTLISHPNSESRDGMKEDITEKLSNAQDNLFREVRDCSLNMLGIKTKELLQKLQNVKDTQGEATSIEEMAAYLAKIKKLDVAKTKGLLDKHTNIATHINRLNRANEASQCQDIEGEIISLDYPVKDILAKLEVKMVKDSCPLSSRREKSSGDSESEELKSNKLTILRLICLLSITQSGLKKEDFDWVRKAFITCYGWDQIPLLMNLQDAGILRLNDKKFDFAKISQKTFKLIPDESDMANPRDIAYVYNGIKPLSITIIQTLMHLQGLKNMAKYIKELNIPCTLPPQNEEELFTKKAQKKRKIMIYFVGGITYSEISAIRFLSKSGTFGNDKEFIIATTSIINSRKVLTQLTPEIQNNIDVQSVLEDKPQQKK